MRSPGDAELVELRSLPEDVRLDRIRVLEAAVRAAPTVWTRRGGVPPVWITLHGTGDRGEVRVERARRGELSEHIDFDGPRSTRSFFPAVRARLGTGRCAALVCGNAIESRTWGWIVPLLLGAGRPRLDTAVMVHLVHGTGARSAYFLPIAFRPGPLGRRLGFDAGVHDFLAHAREPLRPDDPAP